MKEIISRKESRPIWRAWSATFCRGGPARWDTIVNARYNHGALKVYRALPQLEVIIGAPDTGFWRGEMKPYEELVELYREEFDDALYLWPEDLSWTFVIHHEQFGGLVSGPIFAEPL